MEDLYKFFFIYAGERYYPDRAMGDFKYSVATEEEARQIEKSLQLQYDWVEVIDIRGYLL